MQLNLLVARPVCSARLCQPRAILKLKASHHYPTARRSGVTPSEHELRCAIACCQKRGSGTSSPDRDEPDNAGRTSNKYKLVPEYLQKAIEIYDEGQTLVKSGQVRLGAERLKAAQRKAAEAEAKLAVRVAGRVDVNSPTVSFDDSQSESAIALASLAIFVTIWKYSGCILGVGILFAGAVGIAATSLSTVSDYITKPTISPLLIWFAIFLVAIPEALAVAITNKNQMSLYSAIMNGAQALYYRLLANLVTGEEVHAVPLMPREQQSPEEYQDKLMSVLQDCLTFQVYWTQFNAEARGEVNQENNKLKQKLQKMGVDVDEIDFEI